MELEIKGVGATIPDQLAPVGRGHRSSSSGPEGSAGGQEGWLKGEGWNLSGEPARLSRAVIHPTSRADPLAAP